MMRFTQGSTCSRGYTSRCLDTRMGSRRIAVDTSQGRCRIADQTTRKRSAVCEARAGDQDEKLEKHEASSGQRDHLSRRQQHLVRTRDE
jgi:hypothetical protein